MDCDQLRILAYLEREFRIKRLAALLLLAAEV